MPSLGGPQVELVQDLSHSPGRGADSRVDIRHWHWLDALGRGEIAGEGSEVVRHEKGVVLVTKQLREGLKGGFLPAYPVIDIRRSGSGCGSRRQGKHKH